MGNVFMDRCGLVSDLKRNNVVKRVTVVHSEWSRQGKESNRLFHEKGREGGGGGSKKYLTRDSEIALWMDSSWLY